MVTRYIAITLAAVAAGMCACDVGSPYVGEPPGTPYSPSPQNGANGVAPDAVLGWLCEPAEAGGTLTYDVYLGTENPPPRVAESVTGNSYDPEGLFPGAAYYWKIAAYDDKGLVTEGPIWRFYTVDGLWTQVYSPTTADLNGVAFTDTGEGWAVGDGGTILRYDGVSWALTPSPGILNLNGIAVSGNAGWAVGESGTVLRLSGGTWTDESLGITSDLYGVDLADDGAGWLGGDAGTIYRLVSGSWTSENVSDTVNIYCVAVYDSDAAWAGGLLNVLYEWGTDGWSEVEVPSYDPLPTDTAYRAAAAYADGAAAVWAGGCNVYFSNSVGGEWTFTTAPTPSPINGIHIKTGADYGWAVGDGGTLASYDGSSWYLYGESEVTGDLNDVFTVGKDDAWAVGDGGAIYRFSAATP
jgi:photosystem II stability/assembly factor-like uncharacterized protein